MKESKLKSAEYRRIINPDFTDIIESDLTKLDNDLLEWFVCNEKEINRMFEQLEAEDKQRMKDIEEMIRRDEETFKELCNSATLCKK